MTNQTATRFRFVATGTNGKQCTLITSKFMARMAWAAKCSNNWKRSPVRNVTLQDNSLGHWTNTLTEHARAQLTAGDFELIKKLTN